MYQGGPETNVGIEKIVNALHSGNVDVALDDGPEADGIRYRRAADILELVSHAP